MSSIISTRPAACVFGATGGVGAALVEQLAASEAYDAIYAAARRDSAGQAPVRSVRFDLEDETSIAAAAEAAGSGGELRLVLIATGRLHGEGLAPEKSWSAQSADAYQEAFAINTIGPALIGKHVLPRMAKQGRVVFAAISARVGSIEDNRSGGWHAYRASKAALNMIMRNFALEMSRRNPASIVVALHPGTVQTALSAPFLRPNDGRRVLTPAQSAASLLQVIEGLQPADTGGFFSWDGERLPY
jgi:NAD(P)-dependent dehydrogenase (short-subunit alcohol dehydrogenase family)